MEAPRSRDQKGREQAAAPGPDRPCTGSPSSQVRGAVARQVGVPGPDQPHAGSPSSQVRGAVARQVGAPGSTWVLAWTVLLATGGRSPQRWLPGLACGWNGKRRVSWEDGQSPRPGAGYGDFLSGPVAKTLEES